jgi:L-asparaginase
MPLPKLLLVSLGGTITMTTSSSGGVVPTLTAKDLVAAVPALAGVAELEAVSPRRLPSASLRLDDLLEVAALVDRRLHAGMDGAVVVQGTDTIEETAFVLDLLVGSDKPVVVTGAMRGPESAGADGPANLLAAVMVAATPAAAGLGALVCLNDEIHAARFAQKSHTALPSAFTSPQAGPLGAVIEARARLHLRLERTRFDLRPRAGVDAPVALLKMTLDDDGRLLKTLPELGYRGCVIEGMGAGHVPAAVAPLVEDLARQMPVVLSSRVAAGPAFTNTYGYPGSEIDLLRRGALPAGALSGPKARLLLMLLLRCDMSREALEESFRRYAVQ